MKQINIYHRWLLSIGINSETFFFSIPVGNFPEMMPMDYLLNKDHDKTLVNHILYTYHLKNDNEEKLSLFTPKCSNSSTIWVWEVTPTPEHIMQCTKIFLYTCDIISDHQSVAVADLGNKKEKEVRKSKN